MGEAQHEAFMVLLAGIVQSRVFVLRRQGHPSLTIFRTNYELGLVQTV